MRGATVKGRDGKAHDIAFQSTLLMRGATRLHHLRIRRRYFNPRSSCEERRPWLLLCRVRIIISIHAPHARSDDREIADFLVGVISIHAPHARSDARTARACQRSIYFNPRSSCEERRWDATLLASSGTNFNPRSSCEERPDSQAVLRQIYISIHAPHARSDPHTGVPIQHRCISIHAPHARSDQRTSACIRELARFQSTLLMRGATPCGLSERQATAFQSTLLMRGATMAIAAAAYLVYAFQSTLLMRGATSAELKASATYAIFQSTLLMRGATRHPLRPRWQVRQFQSTLLMRGATDPARQIPLEQQDFNPRSSCEERPEDKPYTRAVTRFQSTLLMRGATCCDGILRACNTISIHAPHARSDSKS